MYDQRRPREAIHDALRAVSTKWGGEWGWDPCVMLVGLGVEVGGEGDRTLRRHVKCIFKNRMYKSRSIIITNPPPSAMNQNLGCSRPYRRALHFNHIYLSLEQVPFLAAW